MKAARAMADRRAPDTSTGVGGKARTSQDGGGDGGEGGGGGGGGGGGDAATEEKRLENEKRLSRFALRGPLSMYQRALARRRAEEVDERATELQHQRDQQQQEQERQERQAQRRSRRTKSAASSNRRRGSGAPPDLRADALAEAAADGTTTRAATGFDLPNLETSEGLPEGLALTSSVALSRQLDAGGSDWATKSAEEVVWSVLFRHVRVA